MDTTEELKQLIEHWISHSHKDASIYEEWAERVQELDPDDTLADGLRKAAKKIYQSVQDLEVAVNIRSHHDFDE